jgi:SAM-dependent methyltransferase
VPYYNHNDHYTGLLLRRVPRRCSAALDVGCGEGRLAGRLTEVSDLVVGIDPDAAAIETARRVHQDAVELLRGDFLGYDFGDRKFDFITAVGSIHHMPFGEVLLKMAGLCGLVA